MQIDIFSLFPAMFAGPFDDSIIMRAQQAELVSIHTAQHPRLGAGKTPPVRRHALWRRRGHGHETRARLLCRRGGAGHGGRRTGRPARSFF